jgi:hypothetical protein
LKVKPEGASASPAEAQATSNAKSN